MAANNIDNLDQQKRSGIHCVAPGCTNFYYKTRDKGVHYHRLPTDRARQKQWLHVLKRKYMPDTRFARICSEHFLSKDYVHKYEYSNGQFQYMKTSELNDSAVPSQFDFSSYDAKNYDCTTASQTTDTVTASDRLQRRRRRDAMKVSRFNFFMILYIL